MIKCDEKDTSLQKKKHVLKTIFTIGRDIVTIFLALLITDYITNCIEISSSLLEFLVYFGILLLATVLGLTIQRIIKMIYIKALHKKEDF